MSDGEFSVYQFFPDETYERVASFVDPETAMRTVKTLTETLGARLGTTVRIIITDGGDFTVLEWKHGEGIVWPDAETLARHRGEPSSC